MWHKNKLLCGALSMVRHINNALITHPVTLRRPVPGPLHNSPPLPFSATAACRHAPRIHATRSTTRCGVEEEGPPPHQGGGGAAASRSRGRRVLDPCRRHQPCPRPLPSSSVSAPSPPSSSPLRAQPARRNACPR
jgi:hypothetical protein